MPGRFAARHGPRPDCRAPVHSSVSGVTPFRPALELMEERVLLSIYVRDFSIPIPK